MKQNIGFFDKLGAGEVTTRITADTNQIQDGMSEKVGNTIMAFSTFIAAFIIGMYFVPSRIRGDKAPHARLQAESRPYNGGFGETTDKFQALSTTGSSL